MSGLIRSEHFPSFSEIDTEENSFSCVYALWRQNFRRCKNTVNSADRFKAAALREEILGCTDHSYRQTLLKEYARLCCCVSKHRQELASEPFLVLQLCKRWAGEIDESREEEAVHSNMAEQARATPSMTTPVQDSVRYTKFKPQIQQDRPTDLVLSPVRLRDSIANRTRSNHGRQSASEEVQTPTSHFVPYATKPGRTLFEAIRRPLLPEERKAGVIYLFTRSSDPGFIKIGFTTRTPNDRLREWQKTCHYVPQLEFAVYEVPHAKRVEVLVQRELSKKRRREQRCRHNVGCVRKHEEWFEIDIQHASAVVEKWTTWMQEGCPYTSAGYLAVHWYEQIERLERHGSPITGEQLLSAMTKSRKDTTESNTPTTVLDSKNETRPPPCPVVKGIARDVKKLSLNAQSLVLLETLTKVLLDLQSLIKAGSEEQQGGPSRLFAVQSTPVTRPSIAALQDYNRFSEVGHGPDQIAVL